MNKLSIGLFFAVSLTAMSASAATLSSVSCSADTLSFSFNNISAETIVQMEAAPSGSSSYSIIGGGFLDGANASQVVEIPTNDDEFTAIIADTSTASYRVTLGGSTTTVSCS